MTGGKFYMSDNKTVIIESVVHPGAWGCRGRYLSSAGTVASNTNDYVKSGHHQEIFLHSVKDFSAAAFFSFLQAHSINSNNYG